MRVITPSTRSAPPPLGTVSGVAEGTHARGTAFNQQWGKGHAGGRGWRRVTTARPPAGELTFSRPAQLAAAGGGPRRASGGGEGVGDWGRGQSGRRRSRAPVPGGGASACSQTPRPPAPPPDATTSAGAAAKELGRVPQTAARPAVPTAEGPSVRPVAPKPGGRGRRSRHFASARPARFPGPGPRPARRRTLAVRVRPYWRFEFPPARRARRNTRMVIAGLFAPILSRSGKYPFEKGQRRIPACLWYHLLFVTVASYLTSMSPTSPPMVNKKTKA
uniref:transmembrane protein 187 isoform X1 n=1 Tax=Callithrix jacchus TaxID=9483 RepID=UPI00159ED608|nr:transmembrane protein 187 isoform X1 [Callithrix jacchus]